MTCLTAMGVRYTYTLQLLLYMSVYHMQRVEAPTHYPTIPSNTILHRTKLALGYCNWFPNGHDCRKIDIRDCCVDIWGPDYRYQNILILKHLENIGQADPESYDLDKVYLEVVGLLIRRSTHKQKLWYMYFRCRDTQSAARLRLAHQVTSRSQVLYTTYYCVQCLPGEEIRLLDAAGSSPPRDTPVSAHCVPSAGNHMHASTRYSAAEFESHVDPNSQALESTQKKKHVVEATGIYSPRSVVLAERKRQCVRYQSREILPGGTLSAALYDSDKNVQNAAESTYNSITAVNNNTYDDESPTGEPSAIIDFNENEDIDPIRKQANLLLMALHESKSRTGDQAMATALADHVQVNPLLNHAELQITGLYDGTIGEAEISDHPGSRISSFPAIASSSSSIMAELNIPAQKCITHDWSGSAVDMPTERSNTFQACAYNENDFNLVLGANSFVSAIDGYLWPELELPSLCG